MKRSAIRRKPHRDPVTADLREYVLTRDQGCLGPRIEMEGPCIGRLELDHVMSAGLGRRGPSTPRNLVSLCASHHYLKTTSARTWRPLLMAYLEHVEGRAA